MSTPGKDQERSDRLGDLIAYCSENGRVVPKPMVWRALYDRLPNRHQKPSGGWEPALPLILGAWHYSSDLEKRLRLQEHLRWANAHDCLNDAEAMLKGLGESDWHHEGD